MNNYKEGSKPTRQGIFEVRLEDGTETVAAWTTTDGSRQKVWHHFPQGRPEDERSTPLVLEGVAAFCTASAQAQNSLDQARTSTLQRIERAYQGYLSSKATSPLYTSAIPECRRLAVGDSVEMGMLKDSVVVALRRAGQDVVCSFHDTGSRSGTEYDNGTAYRAVHWTDLIARGANKHTHMTRPPILLDVYRNSMLSSLMHKVQHGLDANPDYQRGYVWTDQDKHNFLESVFEGRELGRFLFVRNEYPQLDAILDGKQRLNCVCEFVESRIAYKGVYFHEMSRQDRRRVENRSVQFAELPGVNMTKAVLLEIFLQVNAAGVPQSEEHLTHVRELLVKELANVERSQSALRTLESFASRTKVADLYDNEETLQEALATCFPEFEYPDFSHLTMQEVVAKAKRKMAST